MAASRFSNIMQCHPCMDREARPLDELDAFHSSAAEASTEIRNYDLEEGISYIPLDRRDIQYRNLILEHSLSPSDRWFLVDSEWLQRWRRYMLNAEEDSPGRLDNSGLASLTFDEITSRLPGRDYHGVPRALWEYFQANFDAGPEVEWQAIALDVDRRAPRCVGSEEHPTTPRSPSSESGEESGCHQHEESGVTSGASTAPPPVTSGMDQVVEHLASVLQERLQETIQLAIQESLTRLAPTGSASRECSARPVASPARRLQAPGGIAAAPSIQVDPFSSSANPRTFLPSQQTQSIRPEGTVSETLDRQGLARRPQACSRHETRCPDQDVGCPVMVAVRDGDVAAVRSLLQSGSFDPTKIVPEEENLRGALRRVSSKKVASKALEQVSMLKYKNRDVCCQAIHLAVAYKGPAQGREDEHLSEEQILLKRDETAMEMTTLLLDHDPSLVNAMALIPSTAGDEDRQLQPVHLAAGTGHAKTLRLLLDRGADANAPALKSDVGEYYFPIHDAAWFGRVSCAEVLLQAKAELHRQNSDGRTALHLTAMLGHVKMARWLLEKSKASSKISTIVDEGEKQPLDLAVEFSQFPPGKLYLFTKDLDVDEQVQAFLRVAKVCPQAAAHLLRSKTKDQGNPRSIQCTHIDDRWREALQHGAMLAANFTEHQMQAELQQVIPQGQALQPTALSRFPSPSNARDSIESQKSAVHRKKGHVTVKVLADLVVKAPQAAIDLLDALTTHPTVQDWQHNPLPNRALIPDAKRLSPLTCCYVEEHQWVWRGGDRDKHRTTWQARLAQKDIRRGEEVSIKVVKLKGIIDIRLLQALAETNDMAIFSKLAVHGVLKEAWRHFQLMFVASKVLDLLCAVSISLWTFGDWLGHPDRLLQEVCWHIVATHGISQSFLFVWTGLFPFVKYYSDGPRVAFDRACFWFLRRGGRGIVTVFTLLLAVTQDPAEWPTDQQSLVLAANSILHWMSLLVELRGFEATGKRLLPIIKSSYRILGMMVIMVFVMTAFVTAYFALDREDAEEMRAWEVMMMLFAGSEFLTRKTIQIEHFREFRWAVLVATLVGVFVFTACVLNLFIAVLGDCYNIEQERMVCTFLRERSSIMAGMLMRPHFPFLQRTWLTASPSRKAALISTCIVLPSIITMVLVIIVYGSQKNSWISAGIISSTTVLVQVVLRSLVTVDWQNRFLWICYRKGAEDAIAVPVEDCHEELGITSRLKQFLHDEWKSTERWQKDLRGELRNLDGKVNAILGNTGSLVLQSSAIGGTRSLPTMDQALSRRRQIRQEQRAAAVVEDTGEASTRVSM